MQRRAERPNLSPDRQVRRTPRSANAEARPHVAGWFGHRIFPTVSYGGMPLADQEAERCPFLSETLKQSTPCVKAPNSRGVCTISASSNGPRQDWLVCPYRARPEHLPNCPLTLRWSNCCPRTRMICWQVASRWLQSAGTASSSFRRRIHTAAIVMR